MAVINKPMNKIEKLIDELCPDGVEWKKLDEICNIASGGTPAKSKAEFWEGGNIPWIKSESCNNKPVYRANNFITDLGLKNSSAKLLEKNTTLITK
ncbi:MAG: restriction endonuclease subunit S [Rubrobacteridae bacterium]|nr:restriction endonuclease subunit S [Rubrobacteridae bacterium]